MKKMRWLASLLCIMMVVCSMPMMQIFAEGEDVQEPEAVVLDSIAKVLQDGVSRSGATAGDTVAKSKTDDLYASSHDWNFANSTMETYYRSGNGSLAMPEGAQFTAEGLDLSGTNGTDVWRYLPHGQWCFVNAKRDGAVSFRAGYIKVKGDVNIAFTGSVQKRLISVVSKAGSATVSGIDNKATAFVPDNGWVEYIFIPTNSNSVNIWAKKEADAVWTFYGKCGSTEEVSDATPNKGLHLSGTGVIAGWRTFDFNENGYNASYPDSVMVATDAETIPVTADTLVYGADFDVVPPNAVLGAGSSVENGMLDTKATVANDVLGTTNKNGDLKIAGLSIPMNGYAEFKAKGNGAIEAIFDDGTNKFVYHRLPADNYSIQGSELSAFANFVNDSDMAWRTYRVVRTADGYSFYSKAEGDTGWKIMSTAAEASKKASDGKGAYVYFRFHTNCDGVSVGNGQMDYLRIYGTTADLACSIESALGVTTAKNTYNVQVDASTGSREDVAFHSNTEDYAEGTYTADGVALASGDKPTLWAVNPTVNYWSVKNAIVIKAKLGTEDDILTFYGTGINAGTRFNYKIAKDQVNHQGGAEITTIGWLNGDGTSSDRQRFTPGTDWFELMIVEETNQQKFYGKNAQTGNVWIYLGTVNGYEARNSAYPVFAIGASNNAESPTLVKSVMVYRDDNGMTDPDFGTEEPGEGGGGSGEGEDPKPEVDVMDTIQEVLQDGVKRSAATAGDTVAKEKTDDLYASSHDWNFANSTMETYYRSGNGSLALPEGAELTTEGLDLSGTNGNDEWKYSPHSGWAFVNGAGGSNTVLRAGYVKVKGDVTISFTGAEHRRLIRVHTKPNTATTSGLDAKATTFVPDTGWVEYIFIARNSNSINIWAKKATDAAWTYYGNSGTTEQITDETPNNGLHFSGTGVVALWKTFEFNENGYSAGYPDTKLIAANGETTPATANTLVYGAEFDAAPERAVLGAASSVENGVLSAKTTVANESLGIVASQGDIKFNGVKIPENGYAEFKVKGNGTIEMLFDDGVNKFTINRLPADNYSIQGTAASTYAAFVNDSDMAWRTYRVVRTSEGYSCYSKAEGDTAWRIMGIAAEASKAQTAGKGAYTYFRFHANCDGVSIGDGQLDYLRVYGTQADKEEFEKEEEPENPGGGDTPETVVVDTIYEVLQEGVAKSSATQGEAVAKMKTDNLYATTHDWNFENSTMENYSRTGNGSLKMPEGAAFTAEGLDLSGTQGNGEWKYFPHASWAFVNANTGSNVTFRAGYVKVKGKVTISFTGSEHKRLIKVYTEPNVATASGLDAKATTFVPDGGWVEYIFVPRNSNSINIWAKKASDAVWTYCGTSGTTEQVTDASANRGLHFSGTGVVAGWKTFEFNENGYNAGYPDMKTIATEKEATPENADTLWFSEEFDQEITYFPRPVLGAASSVANGVLDTKTTVKNDSLGTVNAEGTLQYDGLVIPVGGYAEFKAKGNGTIEVLFDDGTNQFTMHRLPADNYSIRGTAYTTFANFVNDSDMAWRTYRVVRTAEGYSFYSKAEGDTGWRIMGTAAEESKLASDGKGARIYFRFHTNCDGVSVGNGQLDYLRIYGSMPDAPLNFTDGNTLTVLKNGAELNNPKYFRIIPGKDVTEGTVIVCNYDGRILRKMQTFDVSELNAETFIDVQDGENNIVKVFLWDSLEGNSKGLSNVMKFEY